MYLVKNSKSPFYQIIYFQNGKRTTISTKKKDKSDAEIFLENFKSSLTLITEPIKEEKKSEVITLSKFKDEYLEYIIPLKSKSYVKSIKISFEQLLDFLGDISLKEINTRQLDKFITLTFSRTKRGAHLYYRTLKAAFSKAVSWNYISENPFKKIKFPRLPKNYPVFISEEEFKIILSFTQEEFLKDIFTVAFYTGIREGEIVNMKLSWVDLSTNLIIIKNDEDFQSKSKKERIIPISQKLQNIFIKYFTSNLSIKENYVFTRIKNVKMREDFISKKFKKAVRKANLNDEFHFHSLRHSFASMLVQKGVSLYVVKELLGHEDLSTTQIYSHLQQDNLEKAIALL